MNIASGSSGNATYVGDDHTHILIDSGVARKKINEGLSRLGLNVKDLDAVLVTHEHSDHISSLAVLERTKQMPVYTTQGTREGILMSKGYNGPQDVFCSIKPNEPFMVGDLTITAYRTSHDARESVCFRIDKEQKSCAVVTDLGVYDEELVQKLQNLSALMIEANHDIRMLQVGPYPYPLKLRIAGNKGHLSNEAGGRMLASLLHDKMKYVVLGHLSQQNNDRSLAKLAIENEIAAHSSYKVDDFPIEVASQELGTQIFRL